MPPDENSKVISTFNADPCLILLLLLLFLQCMCGVRVMMVNLEMGLPKLNHLSSIQPSAKVNFTLNTHPTYPHPIITFTHPHIPQQQPHDTISFDPSIDVCISQRFCLSRLLSVTQSSLLVRTTCRHICGSQSSSPSSSISSLSLSLLTLPHPLQLTAPCGHSDETTTVNLDLDTIAPSPHQPQSQLSRPSTSVRFPLRPVNMARCLDVIENVRMCIGRYQQAQNITLQEPQMGTCMYGVVVLITGLF